MMKVNMRILFNRTSCRMWALKSKKPASSGNVEENDHKVNCPKKSLEKINNFFVCVTKGDDYQRTSANS